MNPSHLRNTAGRLIGLMLVALLLAACGDSSKESSKPAAAKPALTVTTTMPQRIDWPQTLKASGNIAAWQEAVIGPEISNTRITEVRANVGDVVKKGQVLARIAGETVESEFAEIRATVAEAEATLLEAQANHIRAQKLTDNGFYSAQQNTQTQTAADTALARLNAAKARLQTAALKRSKAVVLAPDDGIISARSATVGTLTQPGQELFRLIRGSRLEWRAEVSAAELGRLKPGQAASLLSPSGEAVEGVVRAVAPTVDSQTGNALVYVDLPARTARLVSAGMFARGEFRLGQRSALTLPQSAVLLREGFAYVFRVSGDKDLNNRASGDQANAKVIQTKVVTGRRMADRIELIEGSGMDAGKLDVNTPVVASGVGFLADGDVVRIVAAQVVPEVPMIPNAKP